VLSVHGLAVDELVDACTRECRIGRKAHAVVEFAAVVAQHPDIAYAIGIGRAIVCAGHDGVAPECALVPHTPVSLVTGITQTQDLELLGMPVRATDNG